MASSVQPRFGFPGSRISYTCSAAVLAGQLVELTGDREVAPAGANSTAVIGVAQHDVPATRATIQGPQVGDGNELTVLDDCYVELTASGSVNAGEPLIAAAAGAAAADTTPTSGLQIGKALEDASTGETFLAKVSV